jgi:ribosomal protein L29
VRNEIRRTNQKTPRHTVDELERREVEMNEQMFRLRFLWAMGQTETLNKIESCGKTEHGY